MEIFILYIQKGKSDIDYRRNLSKKKQIVILCLRERESHERLERRERIGRKKEKEREARNQRQISRKCFLTKNLKYVFSPK